MPAPLISVALATYNGERYLCEQLDSVLAQAGVAIEVVAVDDGSTDGTLAILHEYARRDGRIKVYANPRNLGVGATFEHAMSLTAGELIAPCDQDDTWHPEKLARLAEAIGACDLAYCDSLFVDADGATMNERISDRMSMMRGRHAMAFTLRNSVSGHASLIRRSLFEIARPFPDALYYDWWLALCAATRNGIAYVDTPLVHFRRHARTVSPLGRSGKQRVQDRATRWLKDRHAFLTAYAQSGVAGHDDAARLLAALDTAWEGGSPRPLIHEIWRQRKSLTESSPATEAIRLQFRFFRKIRQARREAEAAAVAI
ncbi:MAG TPA: glycosyltransferase [Rhodanobacteraceae bacterium]